MVVYRICDREVPGSSLTHCAVEYGPGQAALAKEEAENARLENAGNENSAFGCRVCRTDITFVLKLY